MVIRFFDESIFDGRNSSRRKSWGHRVSPALITSSCNARRYGICMRFSASIFRGRRTSLGVKWGVTNQKNTNKRRNSKKNLGVTIGVFKAISSPRGQYALLVDHGRVQSGRSSELPNRVNYKQRKKNYRQKEKILCQNI